MRKNITPGSAPTHRGAFLAFGLGPHVCIGKHVGLTFGQMLLAEFVRRFRFRLAPGTSIAPKGMVSLQPKQEVTVELEAI